jgi:RNA polymerase sigma-70 factor (ECF subfamily)|tara:strand:+ start:80 stop:715 length:636 start_codon:yes stop_codon:yes gene_type:complete
MTRDKYELLEEENLVDLCKEGDCEAFDELIRRNKPKLYSYVLSKTRNECVTDEIIQIALIKAWKNIGKYKGRAKFLSWATKIAFNAYYDYFRKAKREVSIEEFSGFGRCGGSKREKGFHTHKDVMELKLGLIAEEPLREIKIKELGNKIQKALKNLSKEHKEVLNLREIENLSCQEISQKLNCPYPTVCTRLFYARKNAKKILSKTINNDK